MKIRVGAGGAVRHLCLILGICAICFRPVVQARAADARLVEASAESEVFQGYQASIDTLQPVAQIQAWLGYLRLHPDSRHREYVRARVRFLAAALSSVEEDELLGLLAFEHLPRQLVALQGTGAREAAALTFAKHHPTYFNVDARRQAFDALLRRAGADPDAVIAKAFPPKREAGAMPATRPGDAASVGAVQAPAPGSPTGAERPAEGVASGAAAGTTPVAAAPSGATSPVAAVPGAAPASPGESSAPPGSVTGAAPAMAGTDQADVDAASAPQSAPPIAGASLEAGVSSPTTGATAPDAAQQREQVAMVPPQPGLETDRREPEERRFARWVEVTRDLPPGSALELWSIYLVLYPETRYAKEVQTRIATAKKLVAQSGGGSPAEQAEARKREEAYHRSVEELMVKQEKSFRLLRTVTLLGMGVLGLLALVALAN